MSINWNFGDQRAIETKSTFTKDADAAFDEFCKTYLNSSNGFFMNSPVASTTNSTTNIKNFSSDNNFSNIDTFISNLSNNKSYNSSNRAYLFEQSLQDLSSASQRAKSAKNSISFRDSLNYFKEDALFRSQFSLDQNQHHHHHHHHNHHNENNNLNTSNTSNRKSIDNLINLNDTINKLNINSASTTSIKDVSTASTASNSKATESNVLINLRHKNSRNRPKRRSIENLMETFEEFNKANNKYTQQHPPLIEEATTSNHFTKSNKKSIQLDKSTASTSSISKDKDSVFKSLKMKSHHDHVKSDRPKSFYGYPNNFYIEKYLESSYKTIDIIDHLNDFNKNYERINKEKHKTLVSDFSAISNYDEIKLNEDFSTSSNLFNNSDDVVKTKILNNAELLNQLNNINQLQQEKLLNQSISIINNNNNNDSISVNNDTNNDELNSINNINLLENEVNDNNDNNTNDQQQNVQMDILSSYLNDTSRVYIVNSNGNSNQMISQSDINDYNNRGSFQETQITREQQETISDLPQFNSFLNEFKSSNTSDTRYKKPSCLIDINSELDIPKKKSFSEEFYKPKQANKTQFGQAISFNVTSYDMNSRANKENDSYISDYISSYIAVPPNLKMEKPKGWLGFKVIACGLKKNGELPIPKPNYFVDRGDFGDDAGFFSENVYGDAIGVADGASGNCMLGYDPGDFSRNLMQLCSEIFVRENNMYDAKTLLLKAYDTVQDKTCYGSCTACVLTLSHHTNIMTAANVGDTGYCVLRNSKIVHKSIPQRISYECPRQLDSYPWKEKSRKMGVSYTEILGNDTICERFQVQKDDIIIVSSDGLYDNLEFDEIERIYTKSKNDYDAVKNLVFNSVKFYRKPDDILVLIAKVVDNKPACIQQKFTKDPYTPI